MLQSELTIRTANATSAIISKLRFSAIDPNTERVIALAYLLYLTGKQNYAFQSLNDIIDNDTLASQKRFFLTNFINEEIWNVIQPLSSDYTPDIFKEIVLTYNYRDRYAHDIYTPDSIIRLTQKILNIQDNEYVADLCSRYGNFLISSAINNPNAHYYGYNSVSSYKDIADIRANLLGVNIEIENTNVFELPNRPSMLHNFDKLFSNYPFGIRASGLSSAVNFIESLTDINSYIFPSTSSDWLYNSLLLQLMKEDGKAIAIMTNGACFNTMDMQARRYFVEHGFVETIIALPNALFTNTAIPVTMIVLSNNNNGVKMIDATQMFTKGRRTNELSDKNIEDILFACNNDTEFSTTISNDELKINEYALSPQRYIVYNIPEDEKENYLPFKSVIKKIKRSAPLKASELDKLASTEETNIKYLRLQDIQDGIISDNLHNLKTLEPRYCQYLLKNEDLIMGKIGFPYKVAVAKIVSGQSVLPVGNMYAIELDTEKINPYYIKAFFESELGIAALKSITSGVTIPIISVDRLKNLEIPVPDMDIQNKIANEYLAVFDEIQILKLKLQRATSRLGQVFDEMKGEI